jgi:hypothetical protein
LKKEYKIVHFTLLSAALSGHPTLAPFFDLRGVIFRKIEKNMKKKKKIVFKVKFQIHNENVCKTDDNQK